MVRRPRYIGIFVGSKSMFELETAIENWKQTFGKNDVVGSEEAFELEEHLRELIVDLGKHGLSQREAFMVGADRLGHPSELEHEYAKVNVASQWRRRFFWMLSGYITMSVLGSIISVMVAITGTGMAVAGAGGALSAVAMNAVMVLAWIGLPIVAIRQFQQRSGHGERFIVKWLVAVGVIMVVAPIITSAGDVAKLWYVDVSWYGESAFYLTIGGYAIRLCIMAFCLVALCKLYEPAVSTVD